MQMRLVNIDTKNGDGGNIASDSVSLIIASMQKRMNTVWDDEFALDNHGA